MNSQVSAGLYAWSQDLEASRDVLIRERPAYAMLLGWLERFRLSRRGNCASGRRLAGRIDD
jgi:hypothetical protein